MRESFFSKKRGPSHYLTDGGRRKKRNTVGGRKKRDSSHLWSKVILFQYIFQFSLGFFFPSFVFKPLEKELFLVSARVLSFSIGFENRKRTMSRKLGFRVMDNRSRNGSFNNIEEQCADLPFISSCVTIRRRRTRGTLFVRYRHLLCNPSFSPLRDHHNGIASSRQTIYFASKKKELALHGKHGEKRDKKAEIGHGREIRSVRYVVRHRKRSQWEVFLEVAKGEVVWRRPPFRPAKPNKHYPHMQI